jgi:hypothetical protein
LIKYKRRWLLTFFYYVNHIFSFYSL